MAGPGPNIFVTLGTVTWNVDAEADFLDGGWNLTPTSMVDGPYFDSGCAFPYWETVGK